MMQEISDLPIVRVEVYSTFLRFRGSLRIQPPLRLSDEFNRLVDHIELDDTTAEPLMSSYPVVSDQESHTAIARSAVVMVTVEGGSPQQNSMMWMEKIRHQVVIHTTAFALAADVHLEPRVSLATHLERNPRDFLSLTRVSAVVIASLSGGPGSKPQTMQRDFALVNPANIVSFSVRESEEGDAGSQR